jgi:hypothetical protein
MNQDKPIYCIKSRNGRIEKEGDFAEIVGWLRENRINSDDDLRRLGYAVFEKDELWARVKDFPEFNLSDREGRKNLGHRCCSLCNWLRADRLEPSLASLYRERQGG